MTAAARLERLLDERTIAAGLALAARLLDLKAWDRLGEVFAEDLAFDYGAGGEQHGLAALRATVARYLDRCGPTQHLLGSPVIEVDGDHAVSRAPVQARHQRADDPTGAVFDSNGDYVDTWTRERNGWRIVRREAHWTLHSGDPAILGIDAAGLGLETR